MLNTSCNLPSENCYTEKQMVFQSNKLLEVYIELALKDFHLQLQRIGSSLEASLINNNLVIIFFSFSTFLHI